MKPFRPPFLRKSSDTVYDASAVPKTIPVSERPTKRRKLSQDGDKDEDINATTIDPLTSKAQLSTTKSDGRPLSIERKPLKVVHNPPSPEGKHTKPLSGPEGYYLVLWRKPTAKKNKTWDGDGFLLVRGGYATLYNTDRREIGRTAYGGPLLPGSSLSVAGKDVEVDTAISKEEFTRKSAITDVSSKCSNGVQESAHIVAGVPKPPRQPTSSTAKHHVILKTTPAPKETGVRTKEDAVKEDAKKALNIAAPHSRAASTAFKNPLKEKTIMPQRSGSAPTPRHDPCAEGALVMQRPKKAPPGKEIVDVVVDPELARKLRPHQRDGVKFLYECVMDLREFEGEGAILADEMGLGKTLQTITLLWTLLKQNPVYHDPPKPVVKKALIVCPVTLIDNWRKEFRKWLGNERIGVFIADGKKTRLTDFTLGKSYSVMIIGYERLRTVAEELTRGAGIDIVIADEGHRLKTMQNKSAQAIQTLNTARRIILSGTPIQNDLSEFFCMVNFVNDGILGTYKAFMKNFEGPILKSRQPNALEADIEKGKDMSSELASLTSPFILRRTAEILDKFLPPKTEYVIFCHPTRSQSAIYRTVLASPLFQFALGNGSESALQLITILKKLCNSPSLLNPKTLSTDEGGASNSLNDLIASLPTSSARSLNNASSAKIRVLDSLLMALSTQTKEKIVIVSNYTSTLDILQKLLTSLSLSFLRLDGSTPAAKRQALVDDFNRPSGSVFAFLLSAKAGGLGLNLIGASRLVLFDVDWNPATDAQAMARIHREGQKHHVKIYRFVMKGAVEERIWMRQIEKGGLANSVLDLGGGSSGSKGKSGSLAQFSREELRDLFRLEEGSGLKTHELVGCSCGGFGHDKGAKKGSAIKSVLPFAPVSGKAEPVPVDEFDSGEEIDGASQEDSLPSPRLLLRKASNLDVEQQEALIASGQHPLQNGANSARLSQITAASTISTTYEHFDISRMVSVVYGASIHENGRACFNGRLGEDQILTQVLKEQGGDEEESGLVGWIFKKTTQRALPADIDTE
ncbi:MAG: hypothetical protein Q9227_007379 [Pyrenula ochraceoflavens]